MSSLTLHRVWPGHRVQCILSKHKLLLSKHKLFFNVTLKAKLLLQCCWIFWPASTWRCQSSTLMDTFMAPSFPITFSSDLCYFYQIFIFFVMKFYSFFIRFYNFLKEFYRLWLFMSLSFLSPLLFLSPQPLLETPSHDLSKNPNRPI